MPASQYLLSLILIFSVGAAKAQEFTIGTDRLLHTIAPLFDDPYYHGDIYGGISWNDQKYMLLLNLAFTKGEPTYPEYYSSFLDQDHFFQESWSTGISGRWYLLQSDIKLYMEPAFYLNYLHIYEPLVIRHPYGTYQRIIDNEQILSSIHLGLGMLWRVNGHWEIGGHVRFGWVEPIGDRRFGSTVVIASNIHYWNRHGFYISPLAVRYTF